MLLALNNWAQANKYKNKEKWQQQQIHVSWLDVKFQCKHSKKIKRKLKKFYSPSLDL